MRRTLVLLLVAVVVAACGNGDKAEPPTTGSAPTTTTTVASETAGDYVTRLLDLASKGQFDREWTTLHPAQQAFVPQTKFVECGSQAGVELTKATVVETYETKTAIPGTTLVDQPATAVTVKVEGSFNGRRFNDTETFHAYLVDGSWRWSLSDPQAYKENRCPSG